MESAKKVYYGKVVFFLVKKGYGFISRDDGGADIFFHYSDIGMSGFKVLKKDDCVSFEESLAYNDKLKAINVTLSERK